MMFSDISQNAYLDQSSTNKLSIPLKCFMIDHRAIAMDDFYQDVCVEKIASIFLHINDLQPCRHYNNGLTGSVFPLL